ncbi:helix-turn-helix domain-containing protein [Nocardia inohanensis]|uniref:helix-turn-helix domain-containing protein n=1 Tax=Nocardia inohanensis TaxID=209246 RepID=UPI00082E6A79|nr:helix-turn-helix domain-containing protein [Nocardia inohanensis]
MIKQEEFDRRRAGVARDRAELSRLERAHEFGKRVRAARQSRGWTVDGLARRARVMRGEVAAVESGHPMPATVAGRIAATAGIDPEIE